MRRAKGKDGERTRRCAAKLQALGNETRLAILRLLLRHHPDGLVAGAIGEAVEMAPSTLSRHLDLLQREHLVEREREGRFLRFRARESSLRELLSYLTEECCRKP